MRPTAPPLSQHVFGTPYPSHLHVLGAFAPCLRAHPLHCPRVRGLGHGLCLRGHAAVPDAPSPHAGGSGQGPDQGAEGATERARGPAVDARRRRRLQLPPTCAARCAFGMFKGFSWPWIHEACSSARTSAPSTTQTTGRAYMARTRSACSTPWHKPTWRCTSFRQQRRSQLSLTSVGGRTSLRGAADGAKEVTPDGDTLGWRVLVADTAGVLVISASSLLTRADGSWAANWAAKLEAWRLAETMGVAPAAV